MVFHKGNPTFLFLHSQFHQIWKDSQYYSLKYLPPNLFYTYLDLFQFLYDLSYFSFSSPFPQERLLEDVTFRYYSFAEDVLLSKITWNTLSHNWQLAVWTLVYSPIHQHKAQSWWGHIGSCLKFLCTNIMPTTQTKAKTSPKTLWSNHHGDSTWETWTGRMGTVHHCLC